MGDRLKISPTNITAAALLMQFWLCITVAVCLAVMPNNMTEGSVLRGTKRTSLRSSSVFWGVIVLVLGTFGLLFFSDVFTASWAPMFGAGKTIGLGWSNAFFFVFLVDLAVLAFLIFLSGGLQSPFMSLLFFLPSTSLFLRESTPRVLIYAVICVAIYSFYLVADEAKLYRDDSGRVRLGHFVVAVSSTAMGVVVGLITRPQI